ncbi:phosphate ABC transporter ATP-binding protein [Parathermosynechococcus lividus]
MTYSTAGSATLSLPTVLDVQELSIYYHNQQVVDTVNLTIPEKQLVAFIGPSGSGKSTVLRCFNRLTDLIPQLQVTGRIFYRGKDLYDPQWDVTSIRRQIGMIFQQPNPFPKSIYDNIAFGARVNGYAGNIDELVEWSLQQVHLWDSVKDRLSVNAMALTIGQQQHLCIARAIALDPAVLLLDNPTVNLDTCSSSHLEELLSQLKKRYTLIMTTHNLRQAARISDYTAFFGTKMNASGHSIGYLVEYAPTSLLFQRPQQALTQRYVTGRVL